MKNSTTIDLYNAVMNDQKKSWSCPICRHSISLRIEDGTGSILFHERSPLNQVDDFYLRSAGSAIYSVSIKCPYCLNFINYVGEYSKSEQETSVRQFGNDSPTYTTDENSAIFDGCIYPSNVINDIKTFLYVPNKLISDYEEMAKLVNVSAGAAVAFGRRCLERLIITKWPKVREQHKNNMVPRLTEMIKWLQNNHPEVIELEAMDAIKIIGDKAIHVFDTEKDVEISIQDALLLKETIEDLFNTYFEDEQKRNDRKKCINKRADEIKSEARNIEKKLS